MSARGMYVLALLVGCGRIGFDARPCTDEACELGPWQPLGNIGGGTSGERIVWGSASGGGVSNNLGDVGWYSELVLDGPQPLVAYVADDPDRMLFVRGFDGTRWTDVATPRPVTSISYQFGVDATARPVLALFDIPSQTTTIERWDGTRWVVMPPLPSGEIREISFDATGAPLLATAQGQDLVVLRFDGTAWQQQGAPLNTPGEALINVNLVRGANPVACWTEGSAFPRHILVRRWDGSAWAALGNSTSPTFAAGAPTCAIDDTGAPVLVWSNLVDVFAQRWDGAAWTPLFPGSTTTPGLSGTQPGARALTPRIAVHGDQLAVTWIEEIVVNSVAQYQVWWRAGTATALSPRQPLALSHGAGEPPPLAFDRVPRPCMVAVRGVQHKVVVVECLEQGRWEDLDGARAAIPGISATPLASTSPELVASADGRVELAWQESDGDAHHAYTRQLVGGTWSTRDPSDAAGLGVSQGSSGQQPVLALGPGGTSWLVWNHNSNCLMARQWDGSAWVEAPTGSADVSTCGVLQDSGLDVVDPHVIVDASDRVWAAWSSDCYSFNVYAGTFDGSRWSVVGRDLCDPGLAPQGSFDARLAHHPATGLFVAHHGTDSTPEAQIFVHRWDGVAWSGLAGSERGLGISDGGATGRPRIAVDSLGQLWVTWAGNSSGRWQVYVRMFDGSSWVDLDGSGAGVGVSASPEAAVDPTIVMGPDDQPIVFWSDRASGAWEIYARRWTGTAWQELSGSAHGGGVSNSSAPSASASAIVRGNQVCVTWSEPDVDNDEIRGRCLRLPVPEAGG